MNPPHKPPSKASHKPPAEVHFRWEYVPPLARWSLLFILLFIAALCGMFYWTNALIFGPPGWSDPYYFYALLKSVGVVLAILAVTIFWPRKKQRVLVLVLHQESGAWVWFRYYKRGVLADNRMVGRIQKAVPQDVELRDVDNDPYTAHQLWVHFPKKPAQDLLNVRFPLLAQLPKPLRDALCEELNRQQDGSWRTRPKVVGDLSEDPELEIDPGWDEKAAPPADPLNQ